MPSVFFLGLQNTDIGMEAGQVGSVRFCFRVSRRQVVVPYGFIHEYLTFKAGEPPKPSAINKFLQTMTQAC